MILDSYLFGSNFGKIGKKWLAWFFNSVTGDVPKGMLKPTASKPLYSWRACNIFYESITRRNAAKLSVISLEPLGGTLRNVCAQLRESFKVVAA
jgi:hypothetical protein